MRKYAVTSPSFTGEMIFGYNTEGILFYYENNAMLETEHLVWLSQHFPFLDTQLSMIIKNGKITEITDLSFAKIWHDYGFKVGNKARAEKLWNKLQVSEKIAVFESLPRYKYYLRTHQNLMQAYLETYLFQKRWENEYNK